MALPFPIAELPEKAAGNKRTFTKVVAKLKKMKPQSVDELFRGLHVKAFERISCLDCANCCKGLGPRITDSDIRRLSTCLKMKQTDFLKAYIRVDEDSDYVFKEMPCTFLLADHYCSVYDNRPAACRKYPHTDQKNMKGILAICLRNTAVCPAVYLIFEELAEMVS